MVRNPRRNYKFLDLVLVAAIIKIANLSGQLDESNIDEKIKSIYDVIEKVPNSLKLLLLVQLEDYSFFFGRMYLNIK